MKKIICHNCEKLKHYVCDCIKLKYYTNDFSNNETLLTMTQIKSSSKKFRKWLSTTAMKTVMLSH